MKHFSLKNKTVRFSYISEQFKEWFGDMTIEPGVVLASKKLPRSMNDKETQKELGATEVSLGDVYETLKTLSTDVYSIFYVKDKDAVLRAVGVSWDGGGWGVDAYALDAYRWLGGARVFSRSVPETPPVPLTPPPGNSVHRYTESLDPLERIASALERIATTYEKKP